jgi:Alpha-L-fucosidase
MQYGVMFHWTAQSMPKTGKQKSYKDAVKDFDVDKFASMVKKTGADYVIFTANHASPHFPAPLTEWEKIHPGWTTERDLISEMADALQKNNIKLILYFATHAYGKFMTVDEAEFTRINETLISEVGNRYKDKVVGYWLDGWYQCFNKFPGFDFESFYKCSKAGNANRLLALNSWLYPTITVWQDYWAGEVFSSSVSPKSSIIKEGPGKGLQFQALLALEGDWVHTKENKEIPPPVIETSYLINLIQSCQGKGPVTLNVLIYQDGSISEKSMDVLKTLRKTFKE